MMTVTPIADYDEEHQLGLPEALPDGERLLWQGRPDWRSMARHALHVRKLAVYFAVVLAYYVVAKLSAGVEARTVGLSFLQFAGIVGALLGMLTLYAWGAARATVYTVTDRRLVLRFGLVVPVTFNLPFRKIAQASLNAFKDGTGDLALQLEGTEHIGWFILWPHARPWKMKHAEPTLRCIPDAERVARTLARALSGSAAMPVSAVASGPAAATAGGREPALA
jgi:hypothetical protein